MIAPLYDPDTRGEVVCFAKLGNLGFGALNLGFANSNVDGRDALEMCIRDRCGTCNR